LEEVLVRLVYLAFMHKLGREDVVKFSIRSMDVVEVDDLVFFVLLHWPI
jgi:hypothetical protein